ncbi:Arginine biosynthesis bifunctional protein ArgJ [Includes: Glutamate N-acetyltransferase; Amino-acid acetyltransferase] [Nitrospira japonica]|uniref:Arginine biosynthesis bifunctional protein ArgJ n=1 Tax=Nitrospira japonica TaxID=1325564 RepID=A0A1W1I9T3_9BACT|nr:bifunctional glutamate N-acetyltransferase/amino-acid acetyltransferase ArgJ [Nitrospira japonica]SLM49756.1 Arginine biosynthesis bifunctional protein ArgJ [Includes: Glutamate N-acetyltransferase; Amino-acid acetyltransferase] [Nitrospira japonica]
MSTETAKSKHSQGVTAPKGFRAAGIHCGIKKPGLLDLALVVSDRPGPIAGVFTNNQVVAAPVVLDRQHLRNGVGRAILINSGNANACTGPAGLAAARRTAAALAKRLNGPLHEAFIGSTGVIGRRLPVERILRSLPELVRQLSPRGGLSAAKAIMTTDLRPKSAALRADINGAVVTIGGMAKGSGMIHPNMATMLGYLTTDAAIASRTLQTALIEAVNASFNCISVDGDTSTNDTVLCLANGLADNRVIREGTAGYRRFTDLLTEACRTLALAICRDGEGVTKVVKIEVAGARTVEEARQVARTIGTSNLVKTAFFGEDANWGRVMAAVGRSGVPIVPSKIALSFDGIAMVSKGVGLGLAAERRIARVFRRKEFTVRVELGQGRHEAQLWTTDLSFDYVRINASYRS